MSDTTDVSALGLLSTRSKQDIKLKHSTIFSVFDAITDATPIMERSGAVYPYVRATALGYGFGDERNDNLKDGVCSQISDDCPDTMWEHLKTANDYEAPIGKISQRNSVPSEEILRTRYRSGLSNLLHAYIFLHNWTF